MVYDTIIVGGGPAGLNAALVLGRCGRRVVVVDAGKPRNYAARHMHNYLSRDGLDPAELRRLGRRELEGYGVELRAGRVTRAECEKGGFSALVGRTRLRGRTLLLATGVIDELPRVAGLQELYGLGVHHCPYCDAWEYRGKPMAAYGRGRKGLGLAKSLLTWSERVTMVTDGGPVGRGTRREAESLGIGVRAERIAGLEGARRRGAREPHLRRVVFESGAPLEVDALFFNTGQAQRSRLPVALGCRVNEEGGVIRDRRQRTGIPGLYLAGDASRDVQFVIVAAAEGAKAGVAINSELQRRDREEKVPLAELGVRTKRASRQ